MGVYQKRRRNTSLSSYFHGQQLRLNRDRLTIPSSPALRAFSRASTREIRRIGRDTTGPDVVLYPRTTRGPAVIPIWADHVTVRVSVAPGAEVKAEACITRSPLRPSPCARPESPDQH